MRAVLIALAFVAACAAPVHDNPAPPAQAGGSGVIEGGMRVGDSCHAAGYAQLIGVQESAINRASLPAGARVICAACLVTQDYAPERLNLHLSAEGRVASIRCG